MRCMPTVGEKCNSVVYFLVIINFKKWSKTQIKSNKTQINGLKLKSF